MNRCSYVQSQNETWPDDMRTLRSSIVADDARCSYRASGLITGFALNVNDGSGDYDDHVECTPFKNESNKKARCLWRTMYLCDSLSSSKMQLVNEMVSDMPFIRWCVKFIASRSTASKCDCRISIAAAANFASINFKLISSAYADDSVIDMYRVSTSRCPRLTYFCVFRLPRSRLRYCTMKLWAKHVLNAINVIQL